jgi:hypothetical protein
VQGVVEPCLRVVSGPKQEGLLAGAPALCRCGDGLYFLHKGRGQTSCRLLVTWADTWKVHVNMFLVHGLEVGKACW